MSSKYKGVLIVVKIAILAVGVGLSMWGNWRLALGACLVWWAKNI